MAWTDVLKAVIQNCLARTGYTILNTEYMEAHWRANVESIIRLFAKAEQFALPPDDKRSKLLASLQGATAVGALSILRYLYAAMAVEGAM